MKLFHYLLPGCCLFLASCEFKTYRPVYRFDHKNEYRIEYSASLQGKEEGRLGGNRYQTSADAVFIVRESFDSAKGQVDLEMTIEHLEFHSAERAKDEDAYMTGLLRKYHTHLLATNRGQVLSMTEEPRLPPVEFSPLNFGRLLLYGLVTFPDTDLKVGGHWESEQSLLDSFHPGARLQRSFKLTAVRETPKGSIAEIEVVFDSVSYLTGKGKLEFNLKTGHLIFSDLKMEGHFMGQTADKATDSSQFETLPLYLQESLHLHFSE
jgi:hypothetical protein